MNTELPIINWRRVWKAMHDLHYKQLVLTQAIAEVRAAGHPEPAALAIRTLKHGYLLHRDA